MSSINSLLNHEPASGLPSTRPAQEPYLAKTTLHEAADALTALATLGSGQQYVPSRELPSPTAFNHAPRRTSSFGAHSPTLDQYHHGSKSPEEQRRHSSMLSSSPASVLAPIQTLSSTLHDRMNDEPPQTATDYGADVSQVVPPSRSSEDSGRDTTQDREPAFVRDEPTTSQIREPDAPTKTEIESTLHPIDTDMSLPEANESLQSPVPLIKPEPSGTPREATPAILQTSERQTSVTSVTDNMDVETRKAIEAVKLSELGLRAKKASSITDSIASPTDTKPTPTNAKKRPAPGSSTVKKKGTAAPKKPASKRRKLEPENSAEPGARSATPTAKASKSSKAKKGSHAGTPAAESSPAPDTSSQAHPSDDDGDSSEDSTLYCICRKPDNHKWMIGCDGGCDDWFHGSCVNMVQVDEDLVDRFICPNCETNGKGTTSWKPMCRREECRKPARLEKGKFSKYCSDECGVLFFQEQLQRTAGAKKLPGKKSKKRGKENEQLSGDDDEPTPLGGVLRAKDIKALALASHNIEAFKRLGSGVLSPPQTASPTRASFDGKPNGTKPAEDLSLTPGEAGRLNALHTEKADLQVRLEVLKDREKFVSMAREQATRLAARENMKVKEFCGYDSRLSWSDAEFLRWRKGSTGQAAFNFGTLSPSAEQIASVENAVNGVKSEEEEKEAVCLKKRCPKHPQWQKLNLQDARFEEMEIVEAIKECEKQERSVRDRARRRLAKDTMAAELVGANGDVKQEQKNREGWVEVVEA